MEWFEDAFFLFTVRIFDASLARANGREVDFVARMPDGSRALVQVCESLADPGTRKREVRALNHAMAGLELRAGTIVTRDEEETIPVDAGVIEVVPAWRFLLAAG